MSKGILALVGSGEFTDAVIPIDQYLLSKIKNPKVAILPTAAGEEKTFSKWIEDGVKHFKKLGAEVSGVNLITRDDANNPKILKQLEKFNFYYFSGGDPDYLLKVLKGSPAWDLIYKRYKKEAVLAGSSAGAMVFGKKVWAKVYDFDNKGILYPWEKGLGVVEFGILPHFNTIRKYFNDSKIKQMESIFPKDLKIVGIDEDTAYINMEGNWKVLGKGKVHNPILGLF